MEKELTKPDKYKVKNLERVTIDDTLKEKLARLTGMANDSLDGVCSVSKSDVVNFILKMHPEELSKSQILELKKAHFDVVKYLSWLKNKAKTSLSQGSTVSLDELLSQNSALIVTEGSMKTRKPRAQKKEKTQVKLDQIIPSKDPASSTHLD